MKTMMMLLKKLVQMLSKIPFRKAAFPALVLVAIACAISLIRNWTSSLSQNTVSESGRSIITGIEMKGVLKPIKRYVGGFLDLPSNVPTNAKLRKHFKVVYQWEGSAEFCVDLRKIQEEELSTNRIMLHMPEIQIDNYRVSTFDKKDEPRLLIKEGDKEETERIMFSIDSFVAEKMKRMLDTEENREAARQQTERLLRAMINVASDKIVEFDWGEIETNEL